MTAIVAVLNKHAVAIAADSAVTMGNTHKVVNSANKIFTLSKYHPIAVMTYNNAAFMGTPWDIIIKEYRKQLGESSFPHVEDYVNDFIKFLHLRRFFCDEETQKDNLISLLDSFYELCCNEICIEKNLNRNDIDESMVETKLSQCLTMLATANKCVEFKDYKFIDFLNKTENSIKEFANQKQFSNIPLLSEAFFNYLSAKIPTTYFTGLIFVGYGEDEIYPTLIPVNVTPLVIDEHLKFYIDENNIAKISEHGSAAVISPFAQVDVTQTIIRGITPDFLPIIYRSMEKSISSFAKSITSILDSQPGNEAISNAIKGLDLKQINDAATLQINQEMKETYTDPLLKTVISLDKEDMANMAESFISLTSLVRRMQPGEETVGGPVDVAVISKGDGFVWINRKHYFKPELNASFFNNYFK